jgi:ArsR family transcriptional regulator, arsenate/arsenite/antimonite-responsive transcriptional repressor
MTTSAVDLTADDVRLFADPLRLRIIELLADEELCTCHLVDATGAKQPTVSHHLRILRTAGVVEAEPVGAFTYYRLLPDRLLELSAALASLGAQAQRRRRRRPACD